jgi:hypothetical protein
VAALACHTRRERATIDKRRHWRAVTISTLAEEGGALSSGRRLSLSRSRATHLANSCVPL